MDTVAPNPARKVGVFVLAGLLLIAFLLVNFSKGASLFSTGWNLIIQSENVGGLKPGAPVMMAGVPIGNVRAMDLSADGRAVLISCRILKKYSVFQDARIELEQSGFLGDQFVSIIPTENKGRKLEDGALVKAPAPFNLQEAARSAVTLMNRLDSAATKIDAAVGRVDRLLLSEETLINVTTTVQNFRTVSADASTALAEVKALAKSSAPGISTSISNFNTFSEKLSRLADDIGSVTTNVNQVLARLDGLVLTNQSDLSAGLKDLRATAVSIRSITEGIDRGEGLAGGLLKDEKLHAQFNQVILNVGTLSSNLTKFGLLYKPKESRPAPLSGTYPGRSGFK